MAERDVSKAPGVSQEPGVSKEPGGPEQEAATDRALIQRLEARMTQLRVPCRDSRGQPIPLEQRVERALIAMARWGVTGELPGEGRTEGLGQDLQGVG